MVGPGGLGGDTAACWLCGSEGSGRGCPTVTACPAGQRPPRLAVPALLAAPCVPPLLAAPAGPSPCRAKGACSRGCLVRQKQPPLPLAWDALFKQLCVELSLSVCLSPRLCPSRMKTYYPVGARAEHCGSTGGNDGLSAKFQEPSFPVSSGDLGLLPSPLSAGPRWASVPAALMRVTGSEKLPCDRFRGEPFADAVCVPPSLCPGGCTRICVFISEDCHSRM